MAKPLLVALVGLLVGGAFLLNRAAEQARDTTRKHHLDDLEHALYFARDTLGTYPPYDTPTWCGKLNRPEAAAVKANVEAALRAQNEKYANQAKPWPTDPLFTHDASYDYFYWKHSPAIFELYARLEQAPTGERTTTCPGEQVAAYDYGILSVLRSL